MKPSWVVIAGGSSLSVSPPQRNVSVPVGPAGLADAPVCAVGAHAATSVAAPAARKRSRRVMVESFIARFLPSRIGGEHTSAVARQRTLLLAPSPVQLPSSKEAREPKKRGGPRRTSRLAFSPDRLLVVHADPHPAQRDEDLVVDRVGRDRVRAHSRRH